VSVAGGKRGCFAGDSGTSGKEGGKAST